MIRPAKCHFNGFIKPSIKGAEIRTIIPARGRNLTLDDFIVIGMKGDKNHNPRKGTEFSTVCQTFARLAIWR